ncbi:MAG: hypothetical protein ACE5F1_08005 [Planctomycetota bacterium]
MSAAVLVLALLGFDLPLHGGGEGQIAFLEGGRLSVVGADGSGMRTLSAGPCHEPCWSPDGKQIAFASADAKGKVHTLRLIDADGGKQSTLSEDILPQSWGPTISWSPDATRIAYVGREDQAATQVKICVIDVECQEKRVLATFDREEDGWTAFALAWSPRGDVIALATLAGEAGSVLQLDVESGAMLPLARVEGPRCDLAWSPEGRSLAFTSGEGIFVVEPGGAARKLTQGRAPLWSLDGKSLFFLRGSTGKGHVVCRVGVTDGTADLLTGARIARQGGLSLSGDGTALCYVDLDGRIFRMGADGKRRRELVGAGEHRGATWQARLAPADAAFARGLRYLLRVRNEKGVWDNVPGDTATRADLTLTSLGGLVLLMHGREDSALPDVQEYLLRKIAALDEIEDMSQQEHFRSHVSFQSAFVLMFLVELGLDRPESAELDRAAQRIIALLGEYQWTDGGWAYSRASAPDLEEDPTGARQTLLATTATVVLALALARDAGLEVSEKNLKEGIGYIKGCQNEGGGFRYRVDPKATKFRREHSSSYPGATLIALTALLVAEGKESDEFRSGMRYLDTRWKGLLEDSSTEHYWFWVFFGTLFSQRLGGDFRSRWGMVCREVMLREQRESGAWRDRAKDALTRPNVRKLGRYFATSTALLALRAREGRLRMYQGR